MYDILVVGGGVAGLTAALYARRAGKTVLVVEKNAYGGQITTSPKVENFPAFPSISGMELGDLFTAQAQNAGAETEFDEVVSIEKTAEGFLASTLYGETHTAKTVIFATGARPRPLGVEGEDKYVGRGVSYCAVCDGVFHKGGDVAVVGGGNTALQEALCLADICKTVTLIHRREQFRADNALVSQLAKRENIEVVTPANITELEGEGHLSGITVTYTDGRIAYIPVSGLFVAVGHLPENSLFSPWLDQADGGYADAKEDCLTKTPGIFVAGDCRSKSVRQLTTAAADGAVAALAACHYLDTL